MRQLSNSHVKLLVSRKLLLLKSLFTAERTAQCLQQDRRKLQINLVRLFLDSNLLFLMILIHFKSLTSNNTAAVIIEIIQGESGVLPADPLFMKQLNEYCKQKISL